MANPNTEIFRMELALPLLQPNILILDDDRGLLRLIAGILARRGYSCDTSDSVQSARIRLAKKSYDIVFIDLMLADGSGITILDERTNFKPHTVVVIISGEHELDTAVQVIRKGAYDFISKPFTLALFEERLEKVVEEWRSRMRYQHYQNHLESLVSAMTDKLTRASRQIEHVYDMTVAALGSALDLRDPETEEHCRRVTENSLLLGRALGLSQAELRILRWSAYLHDIGKIGIPEHILCKPEGLTPEEMDVVKTHPVLGYRMISGIDFLKEAADVVLYHHEKFDGSGYPRGLKGKNIPLAARIFALIDTLDAMAYDRPYRKALPFSRIVQELKDQSARHFDPEIVEKFLKIPQNEWRVDKERTNLAYAARRN